MKEVVQDVPFVCTTEPVTLTNVPSTWTVVPTASCVEVVVDPVSVPPTAEVGDPCFINSEMQLSVTEENRVILSKLLNLACKYYNENLEEKV